MRRPFTRQNIFILLLLVILPNTSRSQPVIDGEFEDWAQATISDDTGDVSSTQLDLLGVAVESDDDFIYIYFKIDREINLDEEFDLTLYLDSDNNPNTGNSFGNIGVEIEYQFEGRIGYKYNSSGQSSIIYHPDINLYTAPTITSDTYEIAVRRSKIEFNSATPSQIAVIISTDSDSGDQSATIIHNLTPNPYLSQPYSFTQSVNTDFRIVSYNIKRDAWFDSGTRDDQRNQIKALNPSIIAFQEIYDNSASTVASTLEDILPGDWNFVHHGSDVMVFSRYPVIATNAIDGNEISLLNVDGNPLVIVNVHFPCCANDADRQREIDHILSILRDRNTSSEITFDFDSETPVIITGDYNLVGESQQYHSLLSGDIVNTTTYGNDFEMEADGSAFADANPIHTSLPSNHTWYNPESSFTPGKLDLFIYSDSSLKLENTFIMNTQGLSDEFLQTHDLTLSSTMNASDHLPIVADFKFKTQVNVEDELEANISIYPNPTSETITIQSTHNSEINHVRLINMHGVANFYMDISDKSSSQITVPTHHLIDGIYYLKISTSQGEIKKQFIKISQ